LIAVLGAIIVAGILFFVLKGRKKKSTPKQRSYAQYVAIPCGPLSGSLRIEVEAVGPFADDATLTPFFQREGDDWSARGKFETYRWWASFATIKLTPGSHVIEVPFDANWTAVLTSSAEGNPTAYADALRNAERVGFTIGDITGLGHGEYAGIASYKIGGVT
jgi:hypothetical protein